MDNSESDFRDTMNEYTKQTIRLVKQTTLARVRSAILSSSLSIDERIAADRVIEEATAEIIK